MKITVVGLGYVGTVAAAGLAGAGHDVLGIDIDRGRIDMLSAGCVPMYEPGLESKVLSGLRRGALRFQHRDEVAEDLGDVALIATGTPPTHGGAADLQQVRAAVDVGQVGRLRRPRRRDEEYRSAGYGSQDYGARAERERYPVRLQSGVPPGGSGGGRLGVAGPHRDWSRFR